MADLTRIRKAYIKTETTYGTEAGSTDGSDMTYVDAFSIGQLNDGKEAIEAPQQAGRVWPTERVAGPDAGSIELVTPMIGLSGSATVGVLPPDADWFDILLASTFGTARPQRGREIVSVSSSSVVFGDDHDRELQDACLIWETGRVTPARSQPVLLLSASGQNTFAYRPDISDSPTSNAISPGFRKYVMSQSGSQFDNGAPTFTMTVVQDQNIFTLKGCRPTSFDIDAPVGGNVQCTWTISYDSKTEDTTNKTALPYPTKRSFTPVQGFTNGLWFNNTKYPFRNAKLSFNLRSQNVEDQSAANGKGSIDLFGMDPELTVEPLFSTTLLDLKRAQTSGRLLLQLGAGASGSVGSSPPLNLINAVVISAHGAQINKADPSEDENVTRHSISIMPVDTIEFSGSNADFLSITRF